MSRLLLLLLDRRNGKGGINGPDAYIGRAIEKEEEKSDRKTDEEEKRRGNQAAEAGAVVVCAVVAVEVDCERLRRYEWGSRGFQNSASVALKAAAKL